MRKRVRFVFSPSAAVVAVAMLACGLADGQARDTPAPARGQPPAATTARNDPGPELARLDALAGQWTVRQSMWPDPARPPVVDRGEATLTPVLGGRHLRQELRIDSPKGAFHGLGYLGFDDAAQRYDSLWMDVNFNGMILAHGRYDPSKTATSWPAPCPIPATAARCLRCAKSCACGMPITSPSSTTSATKAGSGWPCGWSTRGNKRAAHARRTVQSARRAITTSSSARSRASRRMSR